MYVKLTTYRDVRNIANRKFQPPVPHSNTDLLTIHAEKCLHESSRIQVRLQHPGGAQKGKKD